ncbi:primosomal replication protein N [Neisseria weaveri]|uniref:primosomal replication protein N n=1 Tax=Neisseria weaveri TaxID=28091 RepID=UPI0002230A20|nr:primosomal replication protein N [Neisseria weaveri]EGV38069.1 primosomal replication protein N [Neisseria weaveri LMG 5135]
MNNFVRLTAKIAECGELRFTPAGIPVLNLLLKHESWQIENGQQCLVKFDIPARLIGNQAELWQYRINDMVEVEGFLTQKSLKYTKTVLRIQNIKEYKG